MRALNNEKQLMSRAEVAEIFQVSAATIGRWTREGKLPYRKTLGGQHRYPREEVERLWSQGFYDDEGGNIMERTTYLGLGYAEPGQDTEVTGLLAVLDRASQDAEFQAQLAEDPDKALAPYGLRNAEKAALASGDIRWIEENFGKLDDSLVAWLRLRMQQEHEHINPFRMERNGGMADVLRRAAREESFLALLADNPDRALTEYDLTQLERAALASGDIRWIEENFGKLDDELATWLCLRMQQESW